MERIKISDGSEEPPAQGSEELLITERSEASAQGSADIPTTERSVTSGAAEESDPLTSAARLVVGATSLGVDTLARWLRRGEQPAGGEGSADDTGSVVDTVLGVAAQGAQTALSIGARGAEVAGRGFRTAAEGASKVVDWALPSFLREPLDRARERATGRLRQLGGAGQDELDLARATARAAIDDGLDALFARVADSREVQLVIRTQSVTAAEEIVGGLRDRTHQIDDRLEGAARKILRRRPK